jgi:hypothetical protein
MEEIILKKVKLGEKIKIPAHSVFHQESGHMGKIVYVSDDGNTITVKCDRKHNGKTIAFNVQLESSE